MIAGGFMKGIIFDLFGTLIDSERLFYPISLKIAQETSLNVLEIEDSFKELYREFFAGYHLREFKPEKAYYEQVLSKIKERFQLAHEVQYYLDFMFASFVQFKAYPDIEVLRELVENHIICILTNADNVFAARVVETNSIPHHFLVTSESARAYKPSREIFEFALKKMGLRKTDVVFVGDNVEVDIVGALNSGIRAFLIDRNAKDKNKHSEYLRLSNLFELRSLLGD